MTCGHSFHDECLGHWVDACRLEDRAVRCPVCKRTHEDMVIAENEAFPAHQPGGVVNLEDILDDHEIPDILVDDHEIPPSDDDTPDDASTLTHVSTPRAEAEDEAQDALTFLMRRAKAKAKAVPKAKATAKSRAEPKPKAKAKAKAGATPAARSAEWKGAPPPATSATEDEPPAKRSHKAKASAGAEAPDPDVTEDAAPQPLALIHL